MKIITAFYLICFMIMLNQNATAQVNTSGKKYTDEELMKIMDKSSYPNYNKHQSALLRMDTIFGDTNSDHHSHEEEEEPASKLPLTQSEKVYLLKWAKSTLDVIKNTYSEYLNVYQVQMNSEEPLHKLYNKMAMGVVGVFSEEVENEARASGNPIFMIPKKYDDAIEQLKHIFKTIEEEWFKEKSFEDKKESLKHSIGQVDWALGYVDFSVAVLIYKKGENDGAVVTLLKKQEEKLREIDSLKKELNTKFMVLAKADLAKIIPPSDKYTGADKETFRKAIMAEWGKSNCKVHKLVKVIFDSPKWDNQSGRQYNRSISGGNYTGTDYSYSTLNATLIFKKVSDKPEYSRMVGISIIKNHLNKTVSYNWDCDGMIILSKNVR